MSKERIYKAKIASLRLEVWENNTEKDGEKGTFNSITLERSYKDNDDNWKRTNQLRERDIGSAIALLQNVQQQLFIKR